jgi:uncharacterized membrane protein YhdT
MKTKPKTKLGKWSVGLNIFFLVAIIISIFLAPIFNILDYGDKWWDVAVAIVFPLPIIALVFGMVALIKNKDKSGWIYLSIAISILVILFIFLHSLFIQD